METKLIDQGDSARIILKGHIDTRTVKDVEPLFQEAGEKYDCVILDMADVGYISSAGIRALRNLYMILYRKEGKLEMIHVGETVMNVLEMTGLKDLLKLN